MRKELFRFLIPLMLSNALQSLGGTVSSILLGRLVGVDALAAISAFFPVFFFLISFMIGIGGGSSVLIGQAHGARDAHKEKKVAGTTLSFTFFFGLALAAFGEMFAGRMLTLIGTPPNILESTIRYAQINFAGLPLIFLYVVYTTFLRGIGDSKTPFYFLIVSTVLSLVFSPILVIGVPGVLPSLGLDGVAYANVAAYILTLIIFMVYLQRIKHPLRIDTETLHDLKIDFSILKLLLRIGVPTSIQMVLVSVAEIAVISFVNAFGSNATAAYGAGNQIASYVQMPAVSLGMAVSVFGAQAIGAGDHERMKQVLRAGVFLNYTVGGTLVVLTYLFSHELLGLFITDPGTFKLAYDLLMITLWSYVVFGNSNVLAGMMRASGVVFWPTVFSVAAIWLVEVPAAWFLSRQMGIEGIWWAYPASFLVGLALEAVYYQLVWRHKKHKRLMH